MVIEIILRVVHHRIDPGGNVVIGGVSGDAAVRTVDDAVGSDFAPVLDEGGLAVGLMIQLHGSHKFLSGLLDEALPVAVYVQDDAMLIVPAHGLGHHEPDVGPIVIPVLQPHGVTRVGEVSIGVGVDICEQNPQGGIVYLLLKVPLLAVGPRSQCALLIGTQGTGRTVAGYIHLLIEHIGQAHVVDDAAGRFVADRLTANFHVIRGFLRDTGRGRGQARGGERRQGQDAHDAHQRQQQTDRPLDDVLLQNENLL